MTNEKKLKILDKTIDYTMVGLVIILLSAYVLLNRNMTALVIWLSASMIFLVALLWQFHKQKTLLDAHWAIVSTAHEVRREMCNICGSYNCLHCRPSPVSPTRFHSDLRPIDYTDRVYRGVRSDFQTEQDAIRNLQIQAMMMQAPQPIIITSQQNRRNAIGESLDPFTSLTFSTSTSLPESNKRENKEPQKVTEDPIIQRKVLNAISELEVSD